MSRIYTTRAFAYNNTGDPIGDAGNIGLLSYQTDPSIDYSQNYGGVTWWEGPDESTGYVIAIVDTTNSQPTPGGVFPPSASVKFKRSTTLSDPSMVSLVNTVFDQTFVDANSAVTWLNNNGYWTSYNS